MCFPFFDSHSRFGKFDYLSSMVPGANSPRKTPARPGVVSSTRYLASGLIFCRIADLWPKVVTTLNNHPSWAGALIVITDAAITLLTNAVHD